LFSCKSETQNSILYGDIGDIKYDNNLDSANFKLCHEDLSLQFNYNGIGLIYQGEKTTLIRHFQEHFKSKIIEGETGFITIRFIINCQGKAGRYRLSEMGIDLKKRKFNEEIRQGILEATKSLNGWVPYTYKDNTYDYYQYLVFKIEDAQLIEILP
jgi:hypothetical protein